MNYSGDEDVEQKCPICGNLERYCSCLEDEEGSRFPWNGLFAGLAIIGILLIIMYMVSLYYRVS